MSNEAILIGVATPQANPTVELEFREFFRGPVCAQVTRLTSSAAEPDARLVEYMRQMPAALASYDTMPLAAFLFACTGSAYLLGAEAETEITGRLERERGFPVITANQAIEDELEIRAAQRIALLAPYPAALLEASVRYWESKGIDVVARERIDTGSDTRGIYALTDSDVASALDAFDPANADVLLLSGTGMATIAALHRNGMPTISSNLCLAAAALRRIGRWPADAAADIHRLCGIE